jgi:acylphosphatase
MQESDNGQTSEYRAAHTIAHGLVQGVGFRHYTRVSAQLLGVAGWVRNMDDGSVEIWAEGTKDRLQQFIQAIRRGPGHGRVTQLDLTWEVPNGESRSFRIRY